MTNQRDTAVLLREAPEHLAGAVFAAIVDDDDFKFADQRMLEGEYAANAGFHDVALVVHRNEYAQPK